MLINTFYLHPYITKSSSSLCIILSTHLFPPSSSTHLFTIFIPTSPSSPHLTISHLSIQSLLPTIIILTTLFIHSPHIITSSPSSSTHLLPPSSSTHLFPPSSSTHFLLHPLTSTIHPLTSSHHHHPHTSSHHHLSITSSHPIPPTIIIHSLLPHLHPPSSTIFIHSPLPSSSTSSHHPPHTSSPIIIHSLSPLHPLTSPPLFIHITHYFHHHYPLTSHSPPPTIFIHSPLPTLFIHTPPPTSLSTYSPYPHHHPILTIPTIIIHSPPPTIFIHILTLSPIIIPILTISHHHSITSPSPPPTIFIHILTSSHHHHPHTHHFPPSLSTHLPLTSSTIFIHSPPPTLFIHHLPIFIHPPLPPSFPLTSSPPSSSPYSPFPPSLSTSHTSSHHLSTHLFPPSSIFHPHLLPTSSSHTHPTPPYPPRPMMYGSIGVQIAREMLRAVGPAGLVWDNRGQLINHTVYTNRTLDSLREESECVASVTINLSVEKDAIVEKTAPDTAMEVLAVRSAYQILK
ncbi:hypothetical protein C7M84_009658 [Penaeus vannamei]|uniref:Uncharacterized protein n=1 Tax=Penaeus vannamei TaxID=6689 RepID=A0A423T6U4_PENVA|nr:hypothetical protein C7M84_009658 [Penaeus vannamei]